MRYCLRRCAETSGALSSYTMNKKKKQKKNWKLPDWVGLSFPYQLQLFGEQPREVRDAERGSRDGRRHDEHLLELRDAHQEVRPLGVLGVR